MQFIHRKQATASHIADHEKQVTRPFIIYFPNNTFFTKIFASKLKDRNEVGGAARPRVESISRYESALNRSFVTHSF